MENVMNDHIAWTRTDVYTAAFKNPFWKFYTKVFMSCFSRFKERICITRTIWVNKRTKQKFVNTAKLQCSSIYTTTISLTPHFQIRLWPYRYGFKRTFTHTNLSHSMQLQWPPWRCTERYNVLQSSASVNQHFIPPSSQMWASICFQIWLGFSLPPPFPFPYSSQFSPLFPVA